MTLGQKIRDMRKQMGISQEVLGDIINISRQTITKWETDAGVPDVSNLAELAKLFGVPVDYFISNKDGAVTKQLDIDITKYRNNNEENDQILRHFYSEEWNLNYLSFDLYPKNPFLRYGTYILGIFSDTVFNVGMASQLAHQIDNLGENYYLISRDNMKFLAHINKNKLEIMNISDKKIKKGNIFYNLKHFDYEEKMFQIHKYSNQTNVDNKSNLLNIIKNCIKFSVAIIVIMVLFIIIMGLIN